MLRYLDNADNAAGHLKELDAAFMAAPMRDGSRQSRHVADPPLSRSTPVEDPQPRPASWPISPCVRHDGAA